jgi:hypothetical protein
MRVYWGFGLVCVCEVCESFYVVVIPIIESGFLVSVVCGCRHIEW